MDRWDVKELDNANGPSVNPDDSGVVVQIYDGVNVPTAYTLAPATKTHLGGLMAGSTTSIDANGILNVNANAVLTTPLLARPNGVATLDANGKIPTGQLSAIAITNTSVVADEIARTLLPAHVGDVAVQTDNSKTYILQNEPPTIELNWIELKTPGAPVQSVNGMIGAVTLSGRDILQNVWTFEGRTGDIFLQTRDILNAAPLASETLTGLMSVGSGLLVSSGVVSWDSTKHDDDIADLQEYVDNGLENLQDQVDLQGETLQEHIDLNTQIALNNLDAIEVNRDAIATLVTGLRHLEPVKDLIADPPTTPAVDGDKYIVTAPATGDWATHENDVAVWDAASSSWLFTKPVSGDSRWNYQDAANYAFSTTGKWVQAGRGLQGIKGDRGIDGTPGESLKPAGTVEDYFSLPDAPPVLSTYVDDDQGHMWVYFPASTEADSAGYVDMGIIWGQDGADGEKGEKGDKGDKGDAGETFKVSGVVPTSANLPTAPAPLTVLMAQTPPGTLYIYDKTSAAANATTGWVDLGAIAGPRGLKGEKGNDGLGFVPYVDQVWPTGSVVYTPSHRYYRANADIALGDAAPEANITLPAVRKWEDITPPAVTQLTKLTDVSVPTPVADQALVYDAVSSKWIAKTQSFYTKAELDTKLTAVITGISHGESVVRISNDPPLTPVSDEVFIVGTTPTGSFGTHANSLAYFDGAAWSFITPQANEAHLVEDQDAIFHWNGTAWVKIAGTAASSASSGVGEILPWVADVVPIDYLPCDGRVVAVASYTELHTVIGNKYNTGTAADGTTTFAVPDLRGYFLRGAGANKDGVDGGATGIRHADSTKRPTIPFTTDNSGDHTHSVNTNIQKAPFGDHERTAWEHDQAGRTGAAGAHTHTITGGGDAETAPKHIAVQWVIRWKAINGGAQGPKGVPGIIETGDIWMVGSIQQSTLTEAEFKVALGPAQETRWALCDGRDVSTSIWSRITGKTTIPDMRGAYIRMAGTNASPSWIGGPLNGWMEDSTAQPKNRFTTDNPGDHVHTMHQYGAGTDSSRVGGDRSDNAIYTTHPTDGAGSHTHAITGGGDVETRPKTYSLNFYIKIN